MKKNGHNIENNEIIEIGNDRAKLKIHTEAFDGILPGVVIVEGVWPNECFIEGLGINSLIGADSPEPLGGAVFHDSAIWIKKIIYTCAIGCKNTKWSSLSNR